jgi:phospholipid/cholesterol/gamma-HCH transport system substrate-binding protein
VPQLEKVLAQLNPVVRHLSPYTREVGGFFGSLGSMTDVADSLGHLGRMSAIVSVSTLATLTPEVISAYEGLQRLGGIDKSVGPHGFNFYPAPGEMADPHPFRGTYTRLQPDPIPSR